MTNLPSPSIHKELSLEQEECLSLAREEFWLYTGGHFIAIRTVTRWNYSLRVVLESL